MTAKVWTKPWVPRLCNLANHSNVIIEQMKVAKVNSLLNSCSNSWDVNKVGGLFIHGWQMKF